MKHVLFVCTGNTCRSPMAEAIFNHFAKQEGLGYRAKSAGLYVSLSKVEEKARVAIKPYGIVIRHKPTKITKSMFSSCDLVLTMTGEQKLLLEREIKSDKLMSIAECTAGIDISDPYGYGQEEYNNTAKLLVFSIKTLITKLKGGKNG